MRKISVVLRMVLVAVVTTVLPVCATTINFDENGLVSGNSLTNQLSNLGVLFSVTNGTDVIGNGSGPIGSTIAGNWIAVHTTGQSDAVLTVTFVDPSDGVTPGTVLGSGISVEAWDTEASPSPRIIVTAFDIGGTQIGSAVGLNTLFATLNGFSGNVHRLDFLDNGGDGHIIDNLTYGAITPQQVPEPATFFLLGIGLVVGASGYLVASGAKWRPPKWK